MRWGRKIVVFAAFVCLLMSAALAASQAIAAPVLPDYEGATTFPTIHGPSDPEEFSWKVNIGPSQELVQVDARHAEVLYGDGTSAVGITAEAARDATATEVPTTLTVSEGDVITLTVHHRDGNPLAGGAPFKYPITDGPGFVPTYTPGVVYMPAPKPIRVAAPETPRPHQCHRGYRHVIIRGAKRCKRVGHRLRHGTTLSAT